MSELERENLEAHVDLCAERYEHLQERLNRIENNIARLCEEFTAFKISYSRMMIGTAGTVIAAVLTTITVVLLR
jgi:L-rhamnose isomerase